MLCDRSFLRVRVAVLLAAVLLASCAPAASPEPSGWIAKWEPRNAWERALDTVDPTTGTFAKDDALRLFATAFGPLPGVDVQQDLTGITDRTIAIAAVMRHADALTPEQLAAIEAAIEPPAGSEQIVLPQESAALMASADGPSASVAMAMANRKGGDPAGATGDAVRTSAIAPGVKEALQASAETYRSIMAAKLNVSLSGRIIINLAPQPTNEPDVLGQAWSKWPGGAFGDCEITVFPLATDISGEATLATLAHEVFHCFQFDGYHFLAAYLAAPQWVIEGQASWVGESLTSGLSLVPVNHWRRYLVFPWLSLTGRTYDAIGFYSHLAESGTDPWTRFRAMWGAGGDSAAAFVNADAEGPIFLESWGSSIVREPARGAAWDTTGPGITTDSYLLRPDEIVAAGSSVPISTPEFTADAFAFQAASDLVRIRIGGSARLSDGTLDTTQLDGALFCVAGHECEVTCPDGVDAPTIEGTIQERFVIGISGGITGSIGTVRGMDVGSGDECEEEEPNEPPGNEPPTVPGVPPSTGGEGRTPCQTECGESNGDVHIGTLGGFDYDYQGVGEYVLARSADGRFEVQARQAPLGSSRNVSINTALAVKNGDHRMALYLDVDTSTVRMTVDGADVAMTGPIPFGAGVIVPSSEGVRIDTGDGSYVDVIGMSYRGFNLLVEPGPARLDGIVGLMGRNAVDSHWPALPDGTAILPIASDRHEAYVQLYETLGHAWRVTQATSLFDYAAGESTETFTQRAFPAEGDLVYLEDLSQAQRAAGEAACADVADEALHRMCVYDVGVTADAGYGELYETTVTLLDSGQLGSSGERLRVVNLYANEGRGTSIDVYAWAGDATNLGTNSGTGPALVATVPYGQSSPWFDPGQLANGPFAPVNWISVQRHGEAVNGWNFNMLDLARDSQPGLERVLLLASDSPDAISLLGGTAMTSLEIREEAPEGYFPLIDPPEGKALGFLTAHPMFYVDEPAQWAASVGGRCLTDPDFPTLVRTAHATASHPLLLEPGSFEVAIHEFPEGADGFDLNCGRFPVVATTTVSVAAGDRVHLFVYAEGAATSVQVLALPVGD